LQIDVILQARKKWSTHMNVVTSYIVIVWEFSNSKSQENTYTNYTIVPDIGYFNSLDNSYTMTLLHQI